MPNTARIGPMSNPANVSELGSSYRPPTAAREPMRSELISNPVSARMLGSRWGTRGLAAPFAVPSEIKRSRLFRKYVGLFAAVVCVFFLLAPYLAAKFAGYNVGSAAGLYAGSQTISASMGLATDSINRLGLSAEDTKKLLDSIPVAYAVTYIFGTVGSAIVLALFGPALLGIDLEAACKAYEEKHGGKKEFQLVGCAARREKAFDEARNNQQGNAPQKKFRGAAARLSQRILSRKHTRKQQTPRNFQSSSSRDENCWKFEHTVRRDEAPQLQSHSRFPRCSPNHAEQKPVHQHHPDSADACRSAIEDQLAKNAEENLRRAASGCPAERDHPDAEDQRAFAHIVQAFDILMPGPHDFGFGDRRLGRTEPATRQEQALNADRGNHE